MKLEDDVASLLMSATEVTIGGNMQKIEVFPQPAGGAIVSISRDVAGLAQDFREVAPNLTYMSVSQQMGVAGRPKPYRTKTVGSDRVVVRGGYSPSSVVKCASTSSTNTDGLPVLWVRMISRLARVNPT
jgi:hypothetical protein